MKIDTDAQNVHGIRISMWAEQIKWIREKQIAQNSVHCALLNVI